MIMPAMQARYIASAAREFRSWLDSISDELNIAIRKAAIEGSGLNIYASNSFYPDDSRREQFMLHLRDLGYSVSYEKDTKYIQIIWGYQENMLGVEISEEEED